MRYNRGMRRTSLGLAGCCFVLAAYAGCSDSGGGAEGDSVDAGVSGDGSSAGGAVGSGGSAATGGAGGGLVTGGTGGGTAGGGGTATGGATATGGVSGGGTGGGSGSGGGGTGGIIDGGIGGGSPTDVQFTYDPADVQVEACASETVQADLIPLDMYVMLDRSGSMNLPRPLPQLPNPVAQGDCNVGGGTVSRWCFAINALAGFFGAATSDGMGVAMQFFPNGTCSTNCCASGGCCQGAADAIPSSPYGLLPAQSATLVSALNTQVPLGGQTPIEAALRGLSTWTAANVMPGRKMVSVLITDGAPNGCNNNQAALAGIAATHLANNGLETYVIGMDGANFTVLEAIAVSGGGMPHSNYCNGGAPSCHYYDVGNGNPQAFIDALLAIQNSALGCTYNVPTSSTGLVDPDSVEVEYTPGTGAPMSIPRVTTSAQCTGAGWYYDNNVTPTTITLCPATCTQVSADPAGRIDIVLLCEGS